MINIDELFFGAWVLVKIDEGTRILREPHRVTGIMTYNGKPYVQTDESENYRGLECYEPIIITEDIMRSSGFIVDLGSATYNLTYTIKNYGWLEYRFNDSILFERWNNGWSNGEVTFQSSCRRYVHLLQAALRLCGSEIEIIL